MRATIAFALAFAGLTFAQTPTSPSGSVSTGTWQVDSSCDAANIVQTCISQYSPRVSACAGTDYACMCTEYQNLLTCYANCPKDKNRSGVESNIASFCGAASAASAASAATNTAKTVSSASSATSAATTRSGSPTTTGDSTSSRSSSTSTSTPNAAIALTPAGTYGALVGVMAVAGVFL